MVVESFQARLLSPLIYHSFPEAGAAGATTTAPWLGDIALNYAIHYAVHGHEIPLRIGKAGPDYEEDIGLMKTRCSMGMPVDEVTYDSPETKASSFMSEGYEQRRISTMAPNADEDLITTQVTNTPWRGWRQVQAVSAGNLFGFHAVSKTALPDRFTVRMGKSRGTLIEIEKVEQRSSGKPGNEAAVNRHTVEDLLSRSLDTVQIQSEERPLARYQICHGVPRDALPELIGWVE